MNSINQISKNSTCFSRIFIFIFLNFLSPCLLAIDSDQWLIQKIQVEDGLPDTTVFSIQQDQTGFMWFGTTNGLARYDGYSFKIFQHEGTDTNTISNNNAGNIFIDSNNVLWIGSFGGGVNTLDLNTGKLKRYPYSNNKIDEMISENVQTFFEDDKSNIWIGTATGLYQLNKGKLKHYDHIDGNENSLIHSRVWDITADKKGNIWIGTSDGLSRLNPMTGDFKNYKLPDNMMINISSNQFRKVQLSDKFLWIGSATGFYRFNLETESFKSYSSEINVKINDLFLIDEEQFLIASMEGLYQFDLVSNTFVKDKNGDNWQEFNHIDIRNIELDKSGMLWLATRDRGVIKIDQIGGLFQHHNDFIPKDQLTAENKYIWSLEFDSQSDLYLGTSGMMFKQSSVDKFDQIVATDLNQVPGIIRDLKPAHNQGLWIAGSEGLYFKGIDKTKAQEITEPFDLVGIKPTDIFSVEETKSGEIWLALYNVGVLRWNPKTSAAQLIQDYSGGSLTDLNIGHVFQDSDENIWITSYITGVFKYNVQSTEIELFSHDYNDGNSISSN